VNARNTMVLAARIRNRKIKEARRAEPEDPGPFGARSPPQPGSLGGGGGLWIIDGLKHSLAK
jgi:hypothetical protein